MITPTPAAGCSRETARHLAVRMSFEDVIRVAEAKIAPERFRRIAGGDRAEGRRAVPHHRRSSSPASRRSCQVLPTAPGAARSSAGPSGAAGRHRYWGMEIESTTLAGLPALLGAGQAQALPAARPSLRAGAGRDRGLARADRRGRAALRRRRDRGRRMRPPDQGLRRHLEARQRQLPHHRGAGDPPGAGRPDRAQPAADAIASARTAALVDPEGDGLANCLAEIASRAAAVRVAAE